jgi:hypothetical protein
MVADPAVLTALSHVTNATTSVFAAHVTVTVAVVVPEPVAREESATSCADGARVAPDALVRNDGCWPVPVRFGTPRPIRGIG